MEYIFLHGYVGKHLQTQKCAEHQLRTGVPDRQKEYANPTKLGNTKKNWVFKYRTDLPLGG